MYDKYEYPPEWDKPEPTCYDCRHANMQKTCTRCQLTGRYITLQDDACERFEIMELEDY